MSVRSVQEAYPVFHDSEGLPLESGYIYIGVINLDPKTNPVAVYSDAALTTPLLQPIRTVAGYPDDTGPTQVYVNSDYSIEVQNKNAVKIDALSANVELDRVASETVTFLQSGTGAVSRTVDGKLKDIVSVFDFMTIAEQADVRAGTALLDVTVAYQAALDAVPQYGTLDAGTGVALISDELIINTNNITIRGSVKFLAKATSQFEYMMRANSKTGITVENLTFDANHANRSASQTVRYMGFAFLACTGCAGINLKATNCLGYNGTSAVGIAAASGSTRCLLDGCTVTNSGTSGLSPAKDADGFFTSGEQNTISSCKTNSCTDTGFVIESSNNSIISGCSSRLDGAGAAITNATSDDKYGNIIDGLSVFNWKGSVGAIQVSVPGSFSGDIYDSIVSNLTIYANVPTFGGGPAFYVNGTATFGAVQGLNISNMRIVGSTTQGILVTQGNKVSVNNSYIASTTDACIQIEDGVDHVISNCYLTGSGTYGITTTNASEAMAFCNVMDGVANAAKAQGTSTIYSYFNIPKSVTSTRFTKDGGATLNLVGAFDGELMLNNAAGSAPTGSLVNKIQVRDAAAGITGFIPIYDT